MGAVQQDTWNMQLAVRHEVYLHQYNSQLYVNMLWCSQSVALILSEIPAYQQVWQLAGIMLSS